MHKNKACSHIVFGHTLNICNLLYRRPLDLDMFESGLDHLFSLPEVRSDTGAVVIGTSKGSEIALTMSAYLPPGKVSAVISINSPCNVLRNDVTYKGQTVIKGDFTP